MSDKNSDIESRRRFMKIAAGTAAAAAMAGVLPELARAAGLPHLKTSDAMAKALDYTENASTTKNTKHKPGAACANCQFYTGKPGAAWGPCNIFPGKDVSSKGWCISHSPKQ